MKPAITTRFGRDLPAVYLGDAYVTRFGLLRAVAELSLDDGFDHGQWALDDAVTLERLARRIREGYAAEAEAKGGGTA